MWKLLLLCFSSAASQYISKHGTRDALAEQKMLENIRPILDKYISDSLESHKNSLLGLCAEMISDSEKQIERKLEQLLTATTTTPAPRVCDSDWFSSEEKCYYVSSRSEKTDWSTAITRCQTKGANLVEIQTDEEAMIIMRNLPSRVSRTDIIYTGRKRNDNRDWVFLTNEKLVDTSVRSWGSGEPDGGSQNCGCTRKSDDLEMLDCFCTGYNLFYICEIVR